VVVCARVRQSSLWRGWKKKTKEKTSPERIKKKKKKKIKSHANEVAVAMESEKKMSSIFITFIIFMRDVVSLKFTDI